MVKIATYICVFCYFTAAGLLPTILLGQQVKLGNELQKILAFESPIPSHANSALSIAVIDGDSIFYFNACGLEFRNSAEQCHQYGLINYFELGAVSELFTANIILELIALRGLTTDALLSHFLPDGWENEILDSLSFHHYLADITPIPRSPVELPMQSIGITYSEAAIQAFYNCFEAREGSIRSISPLNFALLGNSLDHLSNDHTDQIMGNKYPDLHHRLFNKPLSSHKKIVPGFTQTFVPANAHYGELGLYTYAFGLKATLQIVSESLYQWLIDFKQNEKSTAKMMMKEQSTSVSNDNLSNGYAWHLLKLKKKVTIKVKSGQTLGHYVFVACLPSTGTGVVVMHNTAVSVDEFGILILRMLNNKWKRKSVR